MRWRLPHRLNPTNQLLYSDPDGQHIEIYYLCLIIAIFSLTSQIEFTFRPPTISPATTPKVVTTPFRLQLRDKKYRLFVIEYDTKRNIHG